MPFCSILLLLSITGELQGLVQEAVVVPHTKSRGENARLLCKYSLGKGDDLYSLKWYKDEVEFYRYQPWNNQNPIQIFDVPGIRVDDGSEPSEIILKKVNFRATGIYRCEITSSNFEISEKYEQMTVIELPHKAPTIRSDLAITQYEVGDLLELNCTSEPSHPPSLLRWEINKEEVSKDDYTFVKQESHGRKLKVTSIGLRLRLRKDHFHWGRLKVACHGEVKAVFWKGGAENIFIESPETHYQVLESSEGYWIGNSCDRVSIGTATILLLSLVLIQQIISSPLRAR